MFRMHLFYLAYKERKFRGTKASFTPLGILMARGNRNWLTSSSRLLNKFIVSSTRVRAFWLTPWSSQIVAFPLHQSVTTTCKLTSPTTLGDHCHLQELNLHMAILGWLGLMAFNSTNWERASTGQWSVNLKILTMQEQSSGRSLKRKLADRMGFVWNWSSHRLVDQGK